jgi:flagellar hook assembly protein FlgD
MDNGDFIAQMAQFSTVTGIEEMNGSIKLLVEEFDQARIATASNLLGHSVLGPRKHWQAQTMRVKSMASLICQSILFLRKFAT